jgi:hypothetical protein
MANHFHKRTKKPNTVAMLAFLQSTVRTLFQIQEHASHHLVSIDAVPGLLSVLDECLYREHEPELYKTVVTAHNLLHTWLDIKRQSIELLETRPPPTRDVELLARQALYGACEAIQHLVSEPNVESNDGTIGAGGAAATEGVGGAAGGGGGGEDSDYVCRDTGRQINSMRRKHCWEAKRLYCPDYVWADTAASHSHRLLRHLLKSPLVAAHKDQSIIAGVDFPVATLLLIITTDLPARIEQFRAAMEADTILRRFYLVKMEYRAPFRAFIESHLALQRAPSIDLVQEYMEKPKSDIEANKHASKVYLETLLQTPQLQELLSLEQKIDEFEKAMAKQLYSFSELARYLDQKRASVQPDVLSVEQTADLVETLRRLKGVLCRKQSPDSSTSIRPILLDLQGVPRQEKGTTLLPHHSTDLLEEFVDQLKCLVDNVQVTKNNKKMSLFRAEKRSDLDVPSSILRGCADFDHELFHCQYEDWLAMVERQHGLVRDYDFDALERQIRRGEMRVSLAQAANQSLSVVLKRLEVFNADREKRWLLLQTIVEDTCKRELNQHVVLICPPKVEELRLNPISSLGVFGQALEVVGEPLPMG